MFPTPCPSCGSTVRSKTQATHHRRLCRRGIARRIADLIEMPLGLKAYERFRDHSHLVAHRLTGLPPGKHFVVSHERGTEVVDLKSFATAEEAANHFLTRLDKIKEELK